MKKRERRRIIERAEIIRSAVFFFVLALGAVIALIIPLHPTTSEIEKRDLAKFPSFSLTSFLDGTYFKDIDTWYSDTFPFRESLISANSALQSFNGIGSVQIHGTVKKGDEIPTDNEGKIATLQELPSVEESSSAEATTTTPSSSEEENVNLPTQKLGPVFVAGNAGYELYSFGKEMSEQYAAVINYAADELDGIADVYDIIIPNSTGVVLPENIRKDIGTSDQKEAMSYIFSVMSSKVKKVNIYDVLKEHKNEYIYFRTDHHWTQLGAYYAYTEYCKARGLTAKPIDFYEKQEYPGFLGSFYADSGKAPELAATPDTVEAYCPKATNDMVYVDKNGNEVKWNIVSDVSGWGTSTKYSAFIGGDNPLVKIKNPELSDGSACVVIKESYGNAFVPFLVDHYENVYVLDYRYYKGKLKDFVTENKVKDVIYINNIMATGTSLRINDLIRITK
ncbi:MAG: hypothetical protein IK152_01725 [Lachnospiraceae bacterium]|nr:hypothetical protein [Lachnospiraceae bacterium]